MRKEFGKLDAGEDLWIGLYANLYFGAFHVGIEVDWQTEPWTHIGIHLGPLALGIEFKRGKVFRDVSEVVRLEDAPTHPESR